MEVMRLGFRSLKFQKGNIRSAWKKQLASKSGISSSHTRISRVYQEFKVLSRNIDGSCLE